MKRMEQAGSWKIRIQPTARPTSHRREFDNQSRSSRWGRGLKLCYRFFCVWNKWCDPVSPRLYRPPPPPPDNLRPLVWGMGHHWSVFPFRKPASKCFKCGCNVYFRVACVCDTQFARRLVCKCCFQSRWWYHHFSHRLLILLWYFCILVVVLVFFFFF